MFIDIVPNRDSPPAVLLRESYRDEEGKTQKRTLANLSKLPGDVIEMLKALLKGGTLNSQGSCSRCSSHASISGRDLMCLYTALQQIVDRGARGLLFDR